MQYKTPLFRYISTLYRSIPLLLTPLRESQSIERLLFADIGQQSQSPTSIRITLFTLMQIYSVKILVETHYSGIHALMYHYWFAFGAVCVIVLMGVEILLVKYCSRWVYERYQMLVEIELENTRLVNDTLTQDSNETIDGSFSTY
jgi:Putative adipose-regulatory protein (Seipin)